MQHPDSDGSSLAALYAAERADLTSVTGAALTLVSAAVAYIGLAVFAVLQASVPLPNLVLFALPVPAWALAAFHSLLIGLSAVRSAVCQRLEGRLAVNANLDAATLGMRAGAQVMNPSSAALAFKLAGLLTYLGAFATVATFTVWIITRSSSSGLAEVLALLAYGGAGALVARSYMHGLFHIQPDQFGK